MNITNEKSSSLLNEAVNQFASLPGIGRKTAFKLVLHLLKRDNEQVRRFSNAVLQMKQDTRICNICGNISDDDVCYICSSLSRDKSLICVVENIQDILVIEPTMQYRGLYHVLGGVLSPVEGVGPNELNINSLVERVSENEISELIFALPTTMEGDTTGFYLFKKLEKFNVRITTLARGVAIGEELQYADEITLGQSIINRKPFTTK